MKLTEVCDFQGGSQPPKEEWSFECHDGYIRMLQIRDFTQSERVTPEYIKIRGNIKTCTTDDILIARYGASLGKILTGLAGAYNVAIMRTIPDEKYLRKKYLYYYLQSPFFQNCILNVGSRAAQAGFNKDDLSEIEIQCPALIVQDCIIKQMEKLDTIIKYRKEELSKLDTLVKSRFIEMFGDPVTNPMGWAIDTLDKHLEVIGGYAFKSSEFTDDGIPVLRIGNINSGSFQKTNMVYWVKDNALSRYEVRPGDLVISLTGTVGKSDYGNVCIMGNDYPLYYLNQRNAKLSLFSSLSSQYVAKVLKNEAIKRKLTDISRGIRQANIANSDILNLVIPIPPIAMQNQFADFVQQVDKTKSVLQKLLEKQELLRAALMQEYFG